MIHNTEYRTAVSHTRCIVEFVFVYKMINTHHNELTTHIIYALRVMLNKSEAQEEDLRHNLVKTSKTKTEKMGFSEKQSGQKRILRLFLGVGGRDCFSGIFGFVRPRFCGELRYVAILSEIV